MAHGMLVHVDIHGMYMLVNMLMYMARWARESFAHFNEHDATILIPAAVCLQARFVHVPNSYSFGRHGCFFF